MNINKKITVNSLSVALCTLLFLSGCGGGGSGGTDASTTESLSGNVADGYLVGAKVCLDKNENSKCDSDEPSTITTTHGAYTLSNLTTADINTYPLLVEVDELVVDEDDNQTVAEYYTLKATPGQTFISPISTMIRNYETTNNVTHTVARAAIENLLGISEPSLSVIDYVASDSQEADAIHEKAKIIASMKMNLLQTLGTTANNYDARVIAKYIDDKIMTNLATIKTQVDSNSLDLQTKINNVKSLISTTGYTTALATINNQFKAEDLRELTSSLGTTIYDLTSATTIQQNIKYKKSYLGGTDIKNFTIADSTNKICSLYVLDSSNTFNQYSSYAYMISGEEEGMTTYILGKNTTKDMTFSIAWMYYTMTNSHVDFFVNCK